MGEVEKAQERQGAPIWTYPKHKLIFSIQVPYCSSCLREAEEAAKNGNG